jgi:aryl-alcohol dehydrogenase-like predicted oxidoreductase
MISRRDLLRALGALPIISRTRGLAAGDLRYRLLGRTGRWVVPFALGGIGSVQWTGPGIDPADIMVRAVELGVNYLDSANNYGPSQVNYGEAFRRLHLVPTDPDYNAALRERLYIASKTASRYAINRGSAAATAVDELKRSLTQMFGDGKGAIPEGAYLDCMQIHSVSDQQSVDQIYENLDRREDRSVSRIGALAGLLDFRDGTNYTGLNPEKRRWIRHIGITGHQSSLPLMNALQRDTGNILDTLLVALNANDRRYLSNQNNVLPIAVGRGMGVIAMKVLADGVFYGRPGSFSRSPADIIMSVGRPGAVSSTDLLRYPLSIPGVSCAVVGIGQIDRENPNADQVVANLAASQGDMASPAELRRIEDDVATVHGTETNFFQDKAVGLVQPTGITVQRDSDRVVIYWNTALAGAQPIRSYHIYGGDRLAAVVPFIPQTTLAPLSVALPASLISAEPVRVVASEIYPLPPRRRQ